jgi:CGNR zinc finger
MTAETFLSAMFGKDNVVPQSEMRKAMERVGATPDEHLQWALDFAQKQLNALGVGDWYNTRLELWAFSYPGPAGFPFSRPLPVSLNMFSTESDTRNAQAELKEALRKYGSQQNLDVRLQTHYCCTFLPTKQGGFRGCWGSYVDGYVPKAQKRFFDLLALRGDRLKRCPAAACGRWFVGRPNKKFCSPQCQNRTNVRRFRAKAGDRRSQ